MSKWNISRSTLDIVLLSITLYEIAGIPHALFLGIKYIIILYLLISYLDEIIRIKMITIPILVYGIVTLIATIINQSMFNRIIAAGVYILHILVIYTTISTFIRKRSLRELTIIFIRIFLLIAIVTDILMIFIDYDFSSPSTNYLIGNKFVVSYLHCFVSALLFLADYENVGVDKTNLKYKIGKLTFWGFSLFICVRVTCTTGILMCLLMGIMLYLRVPMKIKKIFSNPLFIVILVGLINILIFGSFSLLTNSYVSEFVSNMLGKSGTWLGRIHIYAMVMEVIKIHPWIGYGYFSNIIEDIMGFGNAQNGVLKIIIDSGIIGLIGYSFLVRNSLKNFDISAKKIWPLIVFVHCMIFASIAEINLTDYLFFLCVAIIFACGKNYE